MCNLKKLTNTHCLSTQSIFSLQRVMDFVLSDTISQRITTFPFSPKPHFVHFQSFELPVLDKKQLNISTSQLLCDDAVKNNG